MNAWYKMLPVIALLTGSVAMAAPVKASFSYDFGGGNLFSGSLIGDYHDQGSVSLLDDYIDNIGGIAGQLNGTPMRGPLYLSAYDSSGRRDDLPARLYMDFSIFNTGFVIVNCDSVVSCTAAYDSGDYNFFLLRWGGPPVNFFDRYPNQGDINLTGVSFSPSWQISVTPVPEPCSLALTTLGLLAAAFFRHRSSRGCAST